MVFFPKNWLAVVHHISHCGHTELKVQLLSFSFCKATPVNAFYFFN